MRVQARGPRRSRYVHGVGDGAVRGLLTRSAPRPAPQLEIVLTAGGVLSEALYRSVEGTP
jgi:hypothetical protein